MKLLFVIFISGIILAVNCFSSVLSKKVIAPIGTIIGHISAKTEGTEFLGVPYAVPPTGNYRWARPFAIPRRQGERFAITYSPACMQPSPTDGANQKTYSYRPGEIMSEDCLYLNVWVPANNHVMKDAPDEKYPVMVWIHGGGFVWGSSSMELYHGEELASKGVIVVSINYRLGIFGYFTHPELTKEGDNKSSGNYGTLDQIIALRWVRKNISAFGGDPDNITLFGESSGATAITHLMSAQQARGLFHKAIIQSGTLPPTPKINKPAYGLAPAVHRGLILQKSLNLSSIQDMRDVPANSLIQADRQRPYFIDPGPIVDGSIIKDQIIDLFEQGKQADVPILVGFTADEGSTYYADLEGRLSASKPESPGAYIESVTARYGELSDQYLSVYPPNDLHGAVINPIRDATFGWAAQRIAKMHTKVSPKTYLYYFDHAPQWAKKRGLGAFHTSDLIYSFNNVAHNPKYSENWPDLNPTEDDFAMGELMSDYWVAFAKTGNPNGNGRPEWKTYTESERDYLAFRDGKGVPSKDLLPEAYDLHETIFQQRRACGNQTWWFNNIGLLAPRLDESDCQYTSAFKGAEQ